MPLPGDVTCPTVRSMAEEPDSPRPSYGFKPRQFERVNPPPEAQAPSADHDILAMQQGIRAREKAAGFDVIKDIRPKKSRRRRDFWVGWLGTWTFLAVAGGLAGGAVGLLAALFLGVFLGAGLWWIMFHLVDDY